jgi:ubiquinone/menaquinone biosynthesis C-methylase UbiE
VAHAESLPFPDKTFDVSLFLFVFHHMPTEIWRTALDEAMRVSRESVIIVDHLRSDEPFARAVQDTWWNTTDHGIRYATRGEWSDFLKGEKILEYTEHGILFKNICYYRLSAQPREG